MESVSNKIVGENESVKTMNGLYKIAQIMTNKTNFSPFCDLDQAILNAIFQAILIFEYLNWFSLLH